MTRRPIDPKLPEVFGLDHAAYRCRDAQETCDFYEGVLGFPLEVAMINYRHPTTGEVMRYLHLFFDIGSNVPGEPSYLAFFDVADVPDGSVFDFKRQWGMDLHFAMKVKNLDAIHEWRVHLEERGVACDGPVDHGVCTSLYFHDPNGYRLEFITYSEENAEAWELHKREAYESLEAWNKIKSQSAEAASGRGEPHNG